MGFVGGSCGSERVRRGRDVARRCIGYVVRSGFDHFSKGGLRGERCGCGGVGPARSQRFGFRVNRIAPVCLERGSFSCVARTHPNPSLREGLQGNAREEGCGFAGGLAGAGGELGGLAQGGDDVGVLVELREDELAQGGDGDSEGVGGDEASAAAHCVLEIVDALGDFGAGHPGGEGGERGVVDEGDVAQGHRILAKVVDGLIDVCFVFGVEDGGEGWVCEGVAGHGGKKSDRGGER